MNERRAYEERSVFFVHPFFNGESEWPMRTHVVCRYDGESFDSIPIPLPIGFNDEKNIYTCYGIFCSAACVKAFMENNPVYSNALSMMWLKKIMCEVFGDFDDIVEAPPIELLNKHGGNLDIIQFRKFGKQKTRILTHRLPFFTCALAFELVKEHGKKIEKGDLKSGTHQQQPTQLTQASLKTVKKLQRESNKKQPVVGEITGENPLLLSQSNLLPDSIIQVPATSGNRWDIHGLQRPQPRLDVQSIVNIPMTPAMGGATGSATTPGMGGATGRATTQSMTPATTPAMTQSMTPATTQSMTPATTQSMTPATTQSMTPATTQSMTPATTQSMTPATTHTKSMFQEYFEQRTQKKEPQKPKESIDTKPQPQRRRGRPRSTAKPDSPKNPSHGTLVSFLKQ
jgi:hypothetical protein